MICRGTNLGVLGEIGSFLSTAYHCAAVLFVNSKALIHLLKKIQKGFLFRERG